MSLHVTGGEEPAFPCILLDGSCVAWYATGEGFTLTFGRASSLGTQFEPLIGLSLLDSCGRLFSVEHAAVEEVQGKAIAGFLGWFSPTRVLRLRFVERLELVEARQRVLDSCSDEYRAFLSNHDVGPEKFERLINRAPTVTRLVSAFKRLP